MVKTKSNEYHLFTCSSPPCILQLLFWYQIKFVNKIWRTRNADMSMSVKWQSKLLLFWKLFLKIQMNSKFDETWFIVFTIKGNSTHFKESNWATTWIWMIKCCKEVNLLLSLQGLRKIFGSRRQQLIQSSSLCLTYFQDDLALSPKTKFVLLHSNFNFYLRCNSMQAL